MSHGELIIYTTEDGRTNNQFKSGNDSIWATQAQIAELLQLPHRILRFILNPFIAVRSS